MSCFHTKLSSAMGRNRNNAKRPLTDSQREEATTPTQPKVPATIMCDDHGEFEQATSGASQTYPKQCSALRKNEHVMIKGRPCKIVEMSTSKTGKHGHAKVHLVGMDVFTNKKLEDICPSTHNMEVPNVTRVDYQLLDVNPEGYLTLMNDNGDTREDLKAPEENDMNKDIKEIFDKGDDLTVTVLQTCGTEMVIGMKSIAK